MSRYFELFSQCRTFPLKAAGSHCDMSINIGIRIVNVNRRKISISIRKWKLFHFLMLMFMLMLLCCVCGPVVHNYKQCSFPVSGKTRKHSPVQLYKCKKWRLNLKKNWQRLYENIPVCTINSLPSSKINPRA